MTAIATTPPLTAPRRRAWAPFLAAAAMLAVASVPTAAHAAGTKKRPKAEDGLLALAKAAKPRPPEAPEVDGPAFCGIPAQTKLAYFDHLWASRGRALNDGAPLTPACVVDAYDAVHGVDANLDFMRAVVELDQQPSADRLHTLVAAYARLHAGTLEHADPYGRTALGTVVISLRRYLVEGALDEDQAVTVIEHLGAVTDGAETAMVEEVEELRGWARDGELLAQLARRLGEAMVTAASAHGGCGVRKGDTLCDEEGAVLVDAATRALAQSRTGEHETPLRALRMLGAHPTCLAGGIGAAAACMRVVDDFVQLPPSARFGGSPAAALARDALRRMTALAARDPAIVRWVFGNEVLASAAPQVRAEYYTLVALRHPDPTERGIAARILALATLDDDKRAQSIAISRLELWKKAGGRFPLEPTVQGGEAEIAKRKQPPP